MIGKWNKSVILSYIGLLFALLGMALALKGFDIKYALVCLIVAGLCDTFDGTVARRCKRTKEEKAFGIELDALIDVFNFVAFPLVICMTMGLKTKYHLIIYAIYTIFAIARLAYFNITFEDDSKAIKYYTGLPVTYAAFFLPVFYLLSYVIEKNIFNYIYSGMMLFIALWYILKVKVPKPNLIASIFFLLLGIVVSILYLFVL